MKLLNCLEALPNYATSGFQLDIQGWNSEHALFAELVTRVQPKTIIEVGTWKGGSCLHMANLTRDLGTKIYCCDTWLGSPQLDPAKRDDSTVSPCTYAAGIMMLGCQFLYNACVSGAGERIYPIQLTSLDGARVLRYFGIGGDLIYIDGDHSYEGCYLDLTAYLPLLNRGGVMFGDDYRDFGSVKAAVDRFAFEQHLKVTTSGPAWILGPA